MNTALEKPRLNQAKIYLETLGCAKNRVDSEVMLNTLAGGHYSYISEPDQADVLILNTCAFLTEAVEESVAAIFRLNKSKKKHPHQKLVVVGCLVERYQKQLMEEIPEIDGVLGTSDYTRILGLIEDLRHGEERRNPEPLKPAYNWQNYNPRKILSTERHYAYLKISEGCNNNCAFCNIPKLRGRQQSLPAARIMAEYQDLLGFGVKEINLLSQDSSNWGVDLSEKPHLYDLVSTILEKNPQEHWLRILYSYPNDYPLGLFSLMNQFPALVPYVDMPFQHINDAVLKSMRRRITRSAIENILEAGQRTVKDLAFRTTLIVGYPNEGDTEFGELLSFVEAGHFEHLGVFCYSDEENIAAHKLGDPIPKKEKLLRRKLIMEAQQQVSLLKNKEKIGKTFPALVTGPVPSSSYQYYGRLATQAVDVDGQILIHGQNLPIGQFAAVRIEEAQPYDLIGTARIEL